MAYSVGIIGSEGKIGQIRKELVLRNPDMILTSTCDVKSLNSASHYNNYKEMLDKEDLDIVFVCTPHKFIPKQVIDSLEKGCHVFAEKPPGVCLDDVLNIKKMYDKNQDLKLQFGFNHRWHDSILKIYDIIKSRDLGRLLWIRGEYGKSHLENWRSSPEIAGRGILLGQGIHMLDIYNLFCGSEWDVKSEVINYPKYDNKLESDVFAILRNKENQVATIHSSATLWKHTFDLKLGFEDGYCRVDGFLTSSRTFGFAEKLIISSKDEYFGQKGNPSEYIIYYDIDKSWAREVNQFVEAIKSGRNIEWGNIQDTYNVMKIIEEIYENGGR